MQDSGWENCKAKWRLSFVFLFLQLVVRHPTEPSYKFEWGSLYMLTGDYMKAKECFHDAVSIQQAHQPRLGNAPITLKNVTKTQLYFLSVNWEVLCFCILMFLQPNDVWGLGSNV